MGMADRSPPLLGRLNIECPTLNGRELKSGPSLRCNGFLDQYLVIFWGELGGFELGWSPVFEGRVLAVRVVVALDVGEEFAAGVGRVFEAAVS
jgi:hypothetical protein